MDWRHAYHDHQQVVRRQLDEAAARGCTRLKLPGGVVVNPRRLSYRERALTALRDAEAIVNISIHQHNEELASKAN